jgi:hypothetical protein
MTPRIWSYGEPESEDLPIRDRPYEHFGEQGFAMADHAPVETRRGEERVDLGEPFVGDAATRGPKNWTRSDERITDDVCERLADDPWVDASDIEVVVHHGEITLTGVVDDRQQRHRAAQLAESVRGVIDVVNRIRVASREIVREPARR